MEYLHHTGPTQEIVTLRYQITAVIRQEVALAANQKTHGWRAFVSDLPSEQLTLKLDVLT